MKDNKEIEISFEFIKDNCKTVEDLIRLDREVRRLNTQDDIL